LTSMVQLYNGEVGNDEIDDLGHMNVRFYAMRALRATATLMSLHGLDPDSLESMGAAIDVHDIFTRHHREQIAGAPLAVMGGVLESTADGVRLYHELSNTDSGERAATFVHRARLRDVHTHGLLDIPEISSKSLGEAIVAWPEAGRSRSIDLDHRAPELMLHEARERGLALRRPRRVLAEECDATGFVPAERYPSLLWLGEPFPPDKGRPPMFDLDDGGVMSLASLESHSQMNELPALGTRIQSFTGVVELARKTMIRRNWVFDLDHERLIGSGTIVEIAIHLGKRRSLEIPPRIRAEFEASAQLDLR
jgi:acyl-CoA thioester hydrolase